MIETCKNCGHDDKAHPNGFLCTMVEHGYDLREECRCPGWVKRVIGINDEGDKLVEGVNDKQ